MDRRTFLGTMPAAFVLGNAGRASAEGAANNTLHLDTERLAHGQYLGDQIWLGPALWANRLQDWQRKRGYVVCRAVGRGSEMRTAHLLTRRLERGFGAARLRVSMVNLAGRQGGFGGLLFGAGGPDIDYHSAMLIQRFAGENGGILAVIDGTGEPSFRAFDAPEDSLHYQRFIAQSCKTVPNAPADELDIVVDLMPRKDGMCDLRLVVSDTKTGLETGCAVLTGVEQTRLCGNVALVSSPQPAAEEAGARWAFSRIETGGGFARYDDRAIGPVLSAMHSLDRTVVKLSAQCMPVAHAALSRLRLDFAVNGKWIEGPIEPIGEGFVAVFRIDDWDSTVDHPYRIVDPAHPGQALYDGTVRADPRNSRPLSIALHSCLIPTARTLDRPDYQPKLALERHFTRWSEGNLLFPHAEMVARCEAREPDLYVFCGDQYYENYPTDFGRTGPAALLDTLYRWYLFLLTYREPLRDRPAIVLADDHDVLQGNLWGNEGEGSDKLREEDGGYKYDKALIRAIYRFQSSHNPDPFDASPIGYDIPVCYGRFVYGATSFAFVEDRKFKDPPPAGGGAARMSSGELLGERQEAFLAAWSKMDKGMPKVCLTATVWGNPQTAPDGAALLDFDSNGYPVDGRNRAVRLLKEAGAIALAGDQHLAMLSIQGIDAHDDGPLFFAAPAGSAFWQRWFEGHGKLANRSGEDPNTGDFVDSFSHRMRVLAVANPPITHGQFASANKSRGNFIADHRLKSEGFGIVRVDHGKREFVFECWPRSGPSVQRADTGGQFPGWPQAHPFPNGL